MRVTYYIVQGWREYDEETDDKEVWGREEYRSSGSKLSCTKYKGHAFNGFISLREIQYQ